jgi:hypothetical protein
LANGVELNSGHHRLQPVVLQLLNYNSNKQRLDTTG